MNATIVAKAQHDEVLHLIMLCIQMNGKEETLMELLFYNEIT